MPKVERRGIYQQTTENLKLLEVSQLSIRPHHVVARKSEFSFFLAHACMHECVCSVIINALWGYPRSVAKHLPRHSNLAVGKIDGENRRKASSNRMIQMLLRGDG